jgi:hypothetical protein
LGGTHWAQVLSILDAVVRELEQDVNLSRALKIIFSLGL